MSLRLDLIRDCLEGAVPGTMATCAPDGTPNIAYLSQVEYIDGEHVALSFQFFNKTRQNVLANPQASLLLVDPHTAAMIRLSLRYLRTETQGPLFERMKAKLAGIASHTGMSGVFVLRGADVYRVESIEQLPGETLAPPAPPRNRLTALRAASERLARCTALDALFDTVLEALEQDFGIRHAMLLMLDPAGQQLYTVASRGYERSGVGSEIALGDGVIGVAARERTAIRIGHMTSEYRYSRAIRGYAAAQGLAGLPETEIPLPGLAEPGSQLAVPVCAFGELLGVIYVESPRELHFSYDDEDALVALGAQLGLAIDALRVIPDADSAAPRSAGAGAGAGAGTSAEVATGTPVLVRHYAENDSVFLGDDYLIKGVAGAIFWLLVREAAGGRRDFSNRELRLDPRLRLPDISDNLEARLILLQRRLQERRACVRIDKTGRGRFRLACDRPLQLEEIGGG